ncbi:MAG: phenylalanine--tRNA ligase subunit alpha [Mobiluncus sp.]|uniref:phenylalanine--tRNA ligase subunit alpha n=1 Tax=Mobiluncus sp. TaxID=47293 RepID=UPI002588D54B|nr:phenylalanine--tRNA ligase subunit alpha [Mobiluncus sp.]MCI6585090.1 phenylalanine--tRNA ligase subunit alpha [Mobiluncus sp.]
MSENVLSPLDEEGLEAEADEALAAIAAAADMEQLKAARTRYNGDKAPLTLAKHEIKNLDPADKATAGKNLGAAQGRVRAALDEKTSELQAAAGEAKLAAERVDVTAIPARHPLGARHPLMVIEEEIENFFVSMGWDIAQGPQVEHEWFNFDALNFDADHPARQMQDTLYIDSASVGGSAENPANLVLRTHTSPVQARVLTTRELPIYVAVPGKVFRADELDATHSPVFNQVEGLAVDKRLTMAHLKGTLDHFARAMFGEEAKTRFRPSFFPFTEPSAEVDLWFPQKKGGAGWIEWGGCGMVNPNVLRACGVDPNVYQGFAFGMGIERTLMLRHGIEDMHDIVEGDVRFSNQFGVFGKGC